MTTHELYDAVWNKCDEVEVSRILDANPELLNAIIDEEWGAGVLHCAIEKRLPQLVRKLLQRKDIDVNMCNINGCTSLYYSGSFSLNVELVKLLLEHKADVNLKRKTGATVLDSACQTNHIALVQLLLETKISPARPTRQDKVSPLLTCVDYNRVELVRILLDAGADTTEKIMTDSWGSPLKWAKSDEVKAMLEAPGPARERRKKYLAKLIRPACQRQWARVIAASSGITSVADVSRVAPARPLQHFLANFPGLTGFIGRVILCYFNNTVDLEEGGAVVCYFDNMIRLEESVFDNMMRLEESAFESIESSESSESSESTFGCD